MAHQKFRYVDLPAEVKAQVQEQHKAMAALIQRRTVGFFGGARDPEFVGSGTLVQHRGRFFVATADHVAERVDRAGVTLFHCAGAAQRGPRVDHDVRELGAKVRRRAGSPRVDVAAVELPSASVARFTSMEFTDSETLLATGGAPEPGLNVWVVGVPAAVRAAEKAAEHNANLETFGVLITHVQGDVCPMQTHESDGRDDGYGSPPELDVHVQWAEALWPTGRWEELPVAGGMSGGGVWSCRAQPDELWSADKAALHGICWYQRRDLGCIRAVPLSQWLNLADAVVEDTPAP